MEQRYECPRCKGTAFQEVGTVQTVTPVTLEAENHEPAFVDYADASEPIWDASDSLYVECSTCLLPLDGKAGRPNVKGFEPVPS